METRDLIFRIGEARLLIAAGDTTGGEGILSSLQWALRRQMRDEGWLRNRTFRMNCQN